MTQADFIVLVSALVQARLFTEADYPIILRHRKMKKKSKKDFPCVHTDKAALRKLLKKSGRKVSGSDAVRIESIQSGKYFVAIPRNAADSRAIQLLEACVRIQIERGLA